MLPLHVSVCRNLICALPGTNISCRLLPARTGNTHIATTCQSAIPLRILLFVVLSHRNGNFDAPNQMLPCLRIFIGTLEALELFPVEPLAGLVVGNTIPCLNGFNPSVNN